MNQAGRLSMMRGGRLPYKKRVEYLESTGTQYIDTGVNVSTTTGFEISAKFLAGFSGVFGASLLYPRYGNDQYTRFHFGRRDNVVGSNKLFLGIFSKNTYRDPSINYSFEHTFKFMPGISNLFYIDNSSSEIGAWDGNSYLPTGTNSFFLFANNLKDAIVGSSETVNLFCKAQCSNAKFYESGVLIRDFIPAIDRNDEPCMYDQVSDSFFYNQGTGSFIAGPDL